MQPAEEGQEDRFLRKGCPREQSRWRHQVWKPVLSAAHTFRGCISTFSGVGCNGPVGFYSCLSLSVQTRWRLRLEERPSRTGNLWAPFQLQHCSILTFLLLLCQLGCGSQTPCLLLPAWYYFLGIRWNFSPSVFSAVTHSSQGWPKARSRASLVAAQFVSHTLSGAWVPKQRFPQTLCLVKATKKAETPKRNADAFQQYRSFSLRMVTFKPTLYSHMTKAFLYYYYYWPCCATCGILVSQPGIKLRPPTMEVPSLNHWTAREGPTSLYFHL